MKTKYQYTTAGDTTKESTNTEVSLFQSPEFDCPFLTIDVVHQTEEGRELEESCMIAIRSAKDIDRLIQKLERVKKQLK